MDNARWYLITEAWHWYFRQYGRLLTNAGVLTMPLTGSLNRRPLRWSGW